MRFKFTKMEGLGNDYIYVNGFEERIDDDIKPELVRKMSDRHFGIGGDGMIFINPSKIADFEMEMWNANGTRAQMCGNGMRCVAKYVYDHKMTEAENFTVESAGKIKYIKVFPKDGEADTVEVNMGEPILEPAEIPVIATGENAVNVPIEILGKTYGITAVSMGNPHGVVFMKGVKDLDMTKDNFGSAFEHHPMFPERVNTEFVEVLDRKHILMRVWERGTGETLACGTGACASAVAGVLNGLTDREVTVTLLGGDLLIRWDEKSNLIYMTGPARKVFDGEAEY
ncbi:MAG: diaminopimelate epimerase [Lachnospiraceae bacterium]|nr:diaminopimelate epimerase [Lachnospiraceae bacterium]